MERAYRSFHLVIYDDFSVINKLNDMFEKGLVREIQYSEHINENANMHFHLLLKTRRLYSKSVLETILLHDVLGTDTSSNTVDYLKAHGKVCSVRSAEEFLNFRQKVEKVEKRRVHPCI